LPTSVSRFLLASLNIELILGGTTISRRRKKLEETARGNGLSDAYTATLNRLKEQDTDKRALGLNALMWVLYSERPLQVEELRHALGVEMDSPDLDPKNAPAIRIIRSCCLGLLTVEESSSTIRLVHFTLQEHLSSDPKLFYNPHATIAEVCLTYLNSGPVSHISPTLYETPSTMPLLEYASYYWGEHARRGVTENVKILAVKLLDRFDEHISARLLLLHNGRYASYLDSLRAGKPTGFTGLHGVAFFGIVEIVPPVLEKRESDVKAADCMGITALIWAARRGHAEVIKALLEKKDVNPNQGDTKAGQTPLWIAAAEGHEGAVKILLEREDVNPDQADTKAGKTPLWIAAAEGHEGVVKMILEREDVNPDHVATKYGAAPLWIAASEGHEGVVKMLLQRKDVNPDQADTKHGWTPLWIAANDGYEGVVRMLLEREDVNPDHLDTKYGSTPLMAAADEGHEGVVKILLERKDVNPDHVNAKYGVTPLLMAASAGREGVTKMLLDRGHVNLDCVDTKYGRTPLGWAAKNGNEGVVKMLLDQGNVNPDLADAKYNRTPLLWAAKGGYEGIVKILLEREDVNPNLEIAENLWIPLSWKVSNGCVEILKVTKGKDDLEYPDWSDIEGSDWGDSRYAYISDSEDSNFGDSRGSDNEGSEAAATPPPSDLPEGYDGVTRILVDTGNANSDKVDHGDQSTPPFSPAHRDEFAVEIRFRSRDVDPITTDSNSQPSLSPIDSNEQEPLPDPKDPVSGTSDNDPPTTQSPAPPSASSMWPLKFLYIPWKSNTHPNNTRSTLPILVNLCWVIRSCLFLLAFLAFLKNSPNRTLPHDVGVALAGKVRRFFVFSLLKLGLGNRYRQDLRRVRRR